MMYKLTASETSEYSLIKECFDCFSSSHRSDLSKSELSIGEEIEEVSIEGPDNSNKVIKLSVPCL